MAARSGGMRPNVVGGASWAAAVSDGGRSAVRFRREPLGGVGVPSKTQSASDKRTGSRTPNRLLRGSTTQKRGFGLGSPKTSLGIVAEQRWLANRGAPSVTTLPEHHRLSLAEQRRQVHSSRLSPCLPPHLKSRTPYEFPVD
ncbi:hypothetical protein MRX96_014891 [Rhipicephalus microplus]